MNLRILSKIIHIIGRMRYIPLKTNIYREMKVKKKTAAFAILLLFFIYNLHAQVSIAPKIGLSYSKLEGVYSNAEYMPGAFFGSMLNFRIHKNYSFQSGILLSGKGTSLNYAEDDEDEILITYLEFPLNSIFIINAGAGFIQFFAGPYLGYAINGRYKYLEDENNLIERIRIGTSDTDEIKPLDIGLNFGVGYLFEGLEVQLGYSRSLSTISNLSDEKLFNNVITISLAYFFGNNTRQDRYHWYRRN